jgi:pyridoxal phosphate enzyme (YggS family)
MGISENYKQLRSEIPDHVTIVLAAKTRTNEEIEEAISAGATDIGENYLQEAEKAYAGVSDPKKVKWHMIGHLQTRKINKALKIFDVVQTIDSIDKALEINKKAEAQNIESLEVYIEVNIGDEESKAGMSGDYDEIEKLAEKISGMNRLKLKGIMTMGPFIDPEELRPYFKTTKKIFDKIKTKNLPNVDLQVLSMGMSDSYKVAIEEGSNMVRLGTIVFGARG